MHGDGARTAQSIVAEARQAGSQLQHVIGEGDVIDAAVLIKAFVLGIQNGADECLWHVFDCDRDQTALAKLAQQFTVLSVDAQRRFQRDVTKGAGIWDLRIEVDIAAGNADHDRAQGRQAKDGEEAQYWMFAR